MYVGKASIPMFVKLSTTCLSSFFNLVIAAVFAPKAIAAWAP